jgi:cytochrome b pre-mRNA-processing protein 3
LIFSRFFGRKRLHNEAIVMRTYETIVAAARQPLLYSDWKVPDSALGRFESLSLHMILFLHRTQNASDATKALAQEVVEEFFKDVDHSLRELGIADAGVPKRMKKLAKMFYGRAASYDAALNERDLVAMQGALMRNIRPDVSQWPDAHHLADHAFKLTETLAKQTDTMIDAGNLYFAVPQPS